MPIPLKPYVPRQHHQQSDETLRRSLMDRKNHSFSWPYSYPPFPCAPGWFSVNGLGYHPQLPIDGVENTDMGVPAWFQSADLRSMPAMTSPRQQPTAQAKQANGASSSSNGNSVAAPPRSSPSKAGIATSVLAASRPSSPMTADAAMQCLASQLRDAIQLCTDCLKTHSVFVAKVDFTTAATRNGVWKDLLEHKFKSSGFLQDGFHNLGRRLGYYMDQAHRAAQTDPALKSDEHERRREAQSRVRCLRLLRAACIEVVSLSEGASVDVLDCKEMLGLMRDMKQRLGEKVDVLCNDTRSEQGQNKEDEQENGGGGS